jgi:hypothetical protein
MKQELQKAMLLGMFLSKFDKDALLILGFSTFSEAFNVLGLSLGVKPLSIRNYRDEFDPFFPNERKGWHKRQMFQSRVEMLEKYKHLDAIEFSKLIKNIIYQNPEIDLLEENIEKEEDGSSSFAKRLLTGQAAEEYFRENYRNINLFQDANIEDTTKLGCGFDFKLNFSDKFYAIEVKGLSQNAGSISVTEKEYKIANKLTENYFIFLVKNFVEKPNHIIYQNPFNNQVLSFSKQEETVIRTSWFSKI